MITFDNISSTSAVRAKVELYNGSALAATCACSDYLQDFVVNRQGDTSKFFGYGVCQKLSLNLIDIDKTLPEITTDNTAKVYFGDGTNFGCPYPTFYIDEINRNEKDRTITCTAYDRLNIASQLKFADLGINTPYTFRTLAQAIASHLGVGLCVVNDSGAFDNLVNEANLNGNETVRNILDRIAECTQTIYYINYQDRLTFKRLVVGQEGIFDITKDLYFELDTKTAKVLNAICHTTELGNNITAEKYISGETQYIRDNPFWDLRPDTEIGQLIQDAVQSIGALSIVQFNCDWEGSYLLELGDCIDLHTNDSVVQSYVLNDTITYDGTLNEITSWEYTENSNETASNPATIGEKLSQTSAKVDKVNKKIDLVVSDVEQSTFEMNEKIAQLTIQTDAIDLKVLQHEAKIDAFEELETGQIVDRMAQIEIELDGINTIVSENTTKVAAIEADNREINAELELLEAADTTLSGRIDSTQSRVSGVEVDLESVKTTVSNQSTKISALESEDAAIKGNIQENSNAIGQLEVTTQNINASVSQANSKITTLTNTTNGLTTTTNSHTEKIGQIEVALDSINLSVSNQSSKITSLETTTSNQGTAIDNLTDAVEENASDIGTLTTTTETHTSQISALQIGAAEISATVTNITETSRVSTENIEEQIEQLTQEVSTKITAEDVNITVRNELANGVEKVETTTGFTFNDAGLTISKSGREMTTTITEDGMTVYRDTTAVLTADNTGVDAKNLKASTYLVIGTNSRFENYGTTRTACFWIGD